MGLAIEESISKNLPMMLKEPLSKMSEEKQSIFVEEFKKRSKNVGIMTVLAVFLPIQLFLLGKTGLGLVYWLTLGGLGIWWVIEIFLTSKRVKEYNTDVGTQILRDMKLMS